MYLHAPKSICSNFRSTVYEVPLKFEINFDVNIQKCFVWSIKLKLCMKVTLSELWAERACMDLLAEPLCLFAHTSSLMFVCPFFYLCCNVVRSHFLVTGQSGVQSNLRYLGLCNLYSSFSWPFVVMDGLQHIMELWFVLSHKMYLTCFPHLD